MHREINLIQAQYQSFVSTFIQLLLLLSSEMRHTELSVTFTFSSKHQNDGPDCHPLDYK